MTAEDILKEQHMKYVVPERLYFQDKIFENPFYIVTV